MSRLTDQRIGAVRQDLSELQCEAMVVTSLVNARWLTGFTGSNATVAITGEQVVLITDSRYQTQANEQLTAFGSSAEVVVTAKRDDSELLDIISGAAQVGLEAANITWQRQSRIAAALPQSKLVPLAPIIEKRREIKDGGELELLEEAAAIADRAFAQTYPLLANPSGITEIEFARALDMAMAEAGAETPSFATIVASGPNGALPHARPSRRVIEAGDLVVLDFGARVGGYGSDMTRTILAGATEPTAEQAHLYESVAQAQQAGLATVKAGAEQSKVDAACRSVLAEAGLEEFFIHGTGHGIGLEIHETPFLSRLSTGTLSSGLVVTVEPGAYLPHLGGVRVEDSVLVTDQGHRPITHSPKGLCPDFG